MMTTFRCLIHSAFCVSVGLALHFGPDANESFAMALLKQVPSIFAHHSIFGSAPAPATPAAVLPEDRLQEHQQASPQAQAAAVSLKVSSPTQSNSTSSAKKDVHQTPKPEPDAHHATHQAEKFKPSSGRELAHEMRDSRKLVENAERMLEKARAGLKKANSSYNIAKREETAAHQQRDSALEALHKARDEYKHATSAPSGTSAGSKAADGAIRKTNRSYELAAAKWQRAKDDIPKRAQAVKDAAAEVKNAEAAKHEAANGVKAIEMATREQQKNADRAQLQAQHLKNTQSKLEELKKERVAEYKQARKDRLAKNGATPNKVQAMKAHEERLVQSVHDIATKAKESRAELKTQTSTSQSSQSSVASKR